MWNSAVVSEMESEEDQKSEPQDERDEKEEQESLNFDKDFLGMQSILHLIPLHENAWNLPAFLEQDFPIIDIVVPPPKSIC